MLASAAVPASEMAQVLVSWLGRLRPTDTDPPVEVVVDCPVAVRRVERLLAHPGIVLTTRRELEARALDGVSIHSSPAGAPGSSTGGWAERVSDLVRHDLRRARRLQLAAEGGHFDALREQVSLLRMLVELDSWLPPSPDGRLDDACRVIGLEVTGRAGREVLALLDRARPGPPGEEASRAEEGPLVVCEPGRLVPAVRDYLRRRSGRTVLLTVDSLRPDPPDSPTPCALEDVPEWWADALSRRPCLSAAVEVGDRLAALRLGATLDAAGVPWLGWSGRTLADSAVGRLVRRALGASGRPPDADELLGALARLVPTRARAGLVARMSSPLRAVVSLGRTARKAGGGRAGSLLAALATALAGGIEELAPSLGHAGLHLPSDGLWPKSAPSANVDLARERLAANVLSVLAELLEEDGSQPERRVSRAELVALVDLAFSEECWWDRTVTDGGGSEGGDGPALLVVPPAAWPGPGVGPRAVVASVPDRRSRGAAERGTGLEGDDALVRLFGRSALERVAGSTGAVGRTRGRRRSSRGGSPAEGSPSGSVPGGELPAATRRSQGHWLVERLVEVGREPRRERLALLAAEALQTGGDEVLAAGLRSLAARAGSDLSRFEGDLTARAPIRIVAAGQALAIRALDDYRACPRRFLVEHVLGVPLEASDPDDLELSPAERGRLVHALLADALLGEVEEEGPLASDAERRAGPAPGAGLPGLSGETDPDPIEPAGVRLAGAHSAGDGPGADGPARRVDVADLADERPLEARTRRALELLGPGDPLWEALRVRQARRLAAQVERVLQLDRRRWRRPGQRPVALELEIGALSSPKELRSTPVDAPSGDGRSGEIVLAGWGTDDAVRLSGRLDRVDRVGQGTYVVIDYKTGHPAPYRRERRVDLGLLQLPLYGEALLRRLRVASLAGALPPEVPASSGELAIGSRAALVDLDRRVDLDVRLVGEYWLIDPRDRPDVVVLELDADRRRLAVRLAEAVVAAAADGLFPPSPDDHHLLPQPCPLCRMSEGWGGPPARRLAGAPGMAFLLGRLGTAATEGAAGPGATLDGVPLGAVLSVEGGFAGGLAGGVEDPVARGSAGDDGARG